MRRDAQFTMLHTSVIRLAERLGPEFERIFLNEKSIVSLMISLTNNCVGTGATVAASEAAAIVET